MLPTEFREILYRVDSDYIFFCMFYYSFRQVESGFNHTVKDGNARKSVKQKSFSFHWIVSHVYYLSSLTSAHGVLYLCFGELCESVPVQAGEVSVDVGQRPLGLGQQLQST